MICPTANNSQLSDEYAFCTTFVLASPADHSFTYSFLYPVKNTSMSIHNLPVPIFID